VPSLLKEYSASALHPMKKDLQRIVQQPMKDAFRVEGVVCRFENQSLILSPQQHDQILLWLQESSGAKQVKQELLYRASHDGWQGQDFHSRCDANGATVTVSSARAASSLAATLTPRGTRVGATVNLRRHF
jgi:hypothetical protein